MKKSPMQSFRDELNKLLPRYEWIVHNSEPPAFMRATGTISSGSNRLSTISVERMERDSRVAYCVTSYGYGARSSMIGMYEDGTLARAVRGLQDKYGREAEKYRIAAEYIRDARAN